MEREHCNTRKKEGGGFPGARDRGDRCGNDRDPDGLPFTGQGKQVAVLEAGRIAGGQTGRTTAKITSQHGLFYHGLISDIGFDKAGLYAKANQEAINAYEEMIRERQIECDWKRLPSYLYTTENGDLLGQETEAAKALGIAADMAMARELPFPTVGAVRFENQAQLHPLKFVRALAEGWKSMKIRR